MEDAFAWIEMIANQVKAQYCFVLKSGIENWDDPIDTDEYYQYEQNLANGSHDSNETNVHQAIAVSSMVHAFRETIEPHESPLAPPLYSQCFLSPDGSFSTTPPKSGCKETHMTASMMSLDARVEKTKKHTHLGKILTPGGDYDESHTTPQLMAYLIRLATYENEYSWPSVVATKAKNKDGIAVKMKMKMKTKRKKKEDGLDLTAISIEEECKEERRWIGPHSNKY